MKILVTGGAGYVGTSLIPQLLEKGHKVRILDNLMFGGEPIVQFFGHKEFEFQNGDIRNMEDVKKAVAGQDAVIHLAAIVGFPACSRYPKLAEEVNVGGTKNLASVLSKNQTVIYASTGSNYGSVEGICTEETPLNPLSLYGRTKTEAEKYLLDNCSTIGYRFATAFGISPRLRLDLLINDFTFKAAKQRYLVVYEKNFRRTFIHVKDMGRAFIFGMENRDKMTGQVYNVGSEKMNYTKEQVCEMIKAATKCEVYYAEIGQDADKRDYEVSYQKINKLGFDTTISVEEGIGQLARAFEVIGNNSAYTNI